MQLIYDKKMDIIYWLINKIIILNCEKLYRQAFFDICELGDLKMLKILYKNYSHIDHNLVEDIKLFGKNVNFPEMALSCACSKYNIDMIKWLIKKFPNINNEIKHDIILNMYEICHIEKKLEIQKLIMNIFPDIDYCLVSENYFIQSCCDDFYSANFYAEILIKNNHKISDESNIESLNRRLILYSITGRKYILKFLELILTVYPNIEKSTYNRLFINACRFGILNLVEFLINQFDDIDYHANDEEAFRYACVNGHLEIAFLLKKTFHDIDHKILDKYCHKKVKHLKILEWLNNDCRFSNTTKSARKN